MECLPLVASHEVQSRVFAILLSGFGLLGMLSTTRIKIIVFDFLRGCRALFAPFVLGTCVFFVDNASTEVKPVGPGAHDGVLATYCEFV